MPTVPSKPKRTEVIILRVSPAEKAMIGEQAAKAGMKVSAYIRREAGIGTAALTSQPGRGDDFEVRVRDYAKTMPARNAELAVKREEAREKATRALAPSG